MFRRLISFLAGSALAANVLVAAPQIAFFEPVWGEAGTVVNINGVFPVEIKSVNFGNLVGVGNALILFQSFTQLQVVVPTDALSGSIYVYDKFNAYDYLGPFQVAPRIDFFQPNEGVPGQQVVLDGVNFVNVFAPSIRPVVHFNGTQAQVTTWTETQATVVVPLGATSGSIRIATGAGTNFTAAKFYLPPVIESFLPQAAGVGDEVAINGPSMTDATAVRFTAAVGGTVAAQFNVIGPSNIVATVPSAAGDGPITVVAPAGSFISNPATPFRLLPKIDQFLPPSGGPGTVVKILGTGLSNTKLVSFGDRTAIFTNILPTRVDAIVPTQAQTGPVTIGTPNGTNTSTVLFSVPPSIQSFSPTRGHTGAVVTVTGFNFTNATKVQFGDANALFTLDDNTKLRATVPANALSGLIKVTAPGGVATSTIPFEVTGPEPLIQGFEPTFGPPGTVVQISGDNFAGTTGVTFDGKPAVDFSVVNNTLLNVVVPANATTGRITVTNPAGSATSSTDFLVGGSADLHLTMTATPNPAVTGGALRYSVQVRNAGPLSASAVQVNFVLPVNVQFVNATGSPGQVDRIGNNLLYQPGNVANGATVQLTVDVLPQQDGPINASAQASSGTPDDAPSNNSAQIQLTAGAPRLSIELFPNGQGLVSWPSAAASYLLESSRTLLPGSWDEVGGEPVETGGQLQISITPDQAATFYRLRKP